MASMKNTDLTSDQPLNRLVELADLAASVTGSNCFCHAVLRVIGEQLQRHALQCRLRCVHLRQHVDAVAVLIHHLLDPPDLSLDSP